jgi:urease accessory protein
LSDVSIVVQARSGRTAVTSVAGTEPWRPRILDAHSGWARVALVQSRASLIRGDDVSLSVEVGPGASLELVELGALLAHDVRSGPEARLSVQLTLADAARLVWLGLPLVLTAGSSIDSRCSADLGRGARLLRGESVVLGRAEEQDCGVLRSRTRFTLEGAPLVDETFSTEDVLTLRSPAVAGDAKMVGALTLAGVRDPDPPAGAMQAHGAATVWREAGATLAITTTAGHLADRWGRQVGLRPPAGAAQS